VPSAWLILATGNGASSQDDHALGELVSLRAMRQLLIVGEALDLMSF